MKKAIGIDLGTTNSVISFKDTDVKIIRNNENEELTRSCVALINHEHVTGRTAFFNIKRDPINTILSIKRLMGGAIKDKMVQEMIANKRYYKFGITQLQRGTEDAVAVLLGGKEYTPEQISSEILSKLKADAEAKLGDEVTHAVITVPAYFTEKQKNATRLAAQAAGLKVQKLLAEPTAAAIAYGVDNLKTGEAKTVLIYDFGGGTFDLSILNIVDGQYMEAGTGGDRWLGGDDIDRSLQEFILNKVQETYKISNLENLIASLPDKKRFAFEGEFRIQVEQAKIQLSSASNANINILGLLEDENSEWIDIDVQISKDEFNVLVKPYIQRTIDLIEELLKEVSYDISMIDHILLVGGSSCIPLVKQMLVEKYGVEKIKVAEKPMLTIAEGAGILSHKLSDSFECPFCGNEVKSNQVSCLQCNKNVEQITTSKIGDEGISYSTNHNYFIRIQDSTGDYKLDRIIEKQNPLPLSVSKTFKTTSNNQKIVKVSLWTDVENGKYEETTMGFFTIEDNLPENSEIVFIFEIDKDEIFNIRVYPKSNKSKEKQIFLGRGNRDSKALKFLSECFDKVIKGNYTQVQQDFFFKAAQKEIEKIKQIDVLDKDSEKWDEIGTTTFVAFEKAEQISDEIDDNLLVVIFGQILCGQYHMLIPDDDLAKMKRHLDQISSTDDALDKINAIQRLKEITDRYDVLVTLFTVKLASMNAESTNLADSNRLLTLHDTIVNHFKHRKPDEAFALLGEALILAEKYRGGDINITTIDLKN